MCLHGHRGNFFSCEGTSGKYLLWKGQFNNSTFLGHFNAVQHSSWKLLSKKKLRWLNYQFILSGQNSWAHYKVLFFCPFLLLCKKEFFWQAEYPVYIHKEVWSMKSGSVLKMKRYAFRMGICQTWMVLKAFENVFLICGWILAFILTTTFYLLHLKFVLQKEKIHG